MESFSYSSSQLFKGYKVPITWDAEQEYDYNNQRISQYRKALGIADGCKHVSSITNSVARKYQGTYDAGKLIVDSMTIGGHIVNGLGYSMTRANLLQLRQEVENQFIIRGYLTLSELQQKAEIDKMINECRKSQITISS